MSVRILWLGLLFISSCSSDGDRQRLLGNLSQDINRIIICSRYGALEVDPTYHSTMIQWLRSAREVKRGFASYPLPEMKLIFINQSGAVFYVYVSYPSKKDIPVIARYHSSYFVLNRHPSIPEFGFFIEKFDDETLNNNPVGSR